MRREGDEAVLTVTLGSAFEGAPGRAHGGVVATLIDEAMGMVLHIVGTPAFTGRLTVNYRAPTPLNEHLEDRTGWPTATAASSPSRPSCAAATPCWPTPTRCSSPSIRSASSPPATEQGQ